MTFFRRPLLPCLLAYLLGLWCVHHLGHHWPLAAIFLGVILIGGCAWYVRATRDYSVVILFGIAMMGAAVMGVREHRAVRAEALVAHLGGDLPRMIAGEVASATNTQDLGRYRVILQGVRVTSGTSVVTLPGKMQVNLEATELNQQHLPATGERIAFVGHIYKPRAQANFFGYDRLEALRHQGIYAAANPLELDGIAIVDPRAGGKWSSMERRLIEFRKRLSSILQNNMGKQEGRLMVAMLFNDMRALNDTEMQVFRESGTLHLFAVSGAHVAILGMALRMIFRAIRFGPRTTWIAICATLFIYLWIIGFVPSATRAYLMLAAFATGHILRREVDGITSLVLAASIVLFFDPAALWDVGFMLSVGGVLGIILFTPLMKLWFWRESRADDGLATWMLSKVLDVFFATISVALILFPLQICLFGFWNAMTIGANLFQGVLATLVLSAGVLTAAAGLVWTPLAQAFGQSASLLMAITYKISVLAADSYWAIFYFRQVPALLICLSYGVILGGYFLTFRDTPEFRLKSRARFVTHAFCGLGMLVAFQQYTDLKPRGLEIWALDVGQGDSTLVRLPNGETILIDAGRPEPNMGAMIVAPQLRAMGIDMLDFIIATHDDEDHTGGIAEVIRRIGTRHLLLPAGFDAKSRSSVEMLETARLHGCIVEEVNEGMLANAKGCRVTVLNPPAQYDPSRPDNESSVVLEVQYRQFKAMLMGDAGLASESRIINNLAAGERQANGAKNGATPVSLLKLGHHGSNTASGQEFIEALRPAYALVSCGAGNNFGHPAARVQARVKAAGAYLLRTDHHGAIRIMTDGEHVDIIRCREP